MAIVVVIVGTESAVRKHSHHIVVHPVADCDTEWVTSYHRRPIMESDVDACDVHVLDDLIQARVVSRNAGKAGAGGRHVDVIVAGGVLHRSDAGPRRGARAGG